MRDASRIPLSQSAMIFLAIASVELRRDELTLGLADGAAERFDQFDDRLSRFVGEVERINDFFAYGFGGARLRP